MRIGLTAKHVLLGIIALLPLMVISKGLAQENELYRVQDGKLLDPQGKLAYFWGVNYSLPFAYGYRAAKSLGIDHKQAIDMDVEHFARMQLDGYRIHVWDRLISDRQGNLLENEHLALLDYLLMKLQEKGIKAIITPIAWWGSGYPEPDPQEPGFSVPFTKPQMNENSNAIAAQRNYLTQFLGHRNRYTHRLMATDPDIIAFELFNEPHHETAPEQSIAYVESLIATVRKAGVEKPLFYNISEQGLDLPFATALCQSSINGIAYQWYPTGLVKNSAIQGNMLPSVAHYADPFANIPACKTKAKMVYEFDAADVKSSVMYPAMARSFREQRFQWATQFAYDPASTAFSNSEYNTHYLNLLYTPKKAVSMMIASKAFHALPEHYQAPEYPASNRFGHARINYIDNMAVYNDGRNFYYSNSTMDKPSDLQALHHIAGVGNSPLVQYSGTGSYFLDRLSPQAWLLEIYPDVVELEDPHHSSSLQREVRRLVVQRQALSITLPGMGDEFEIRQVSGPQNSASVVTQKAGTFEITPGRYLVLEKGAVFDEQQIDVRFTFAIPYINPDKPRVYNMSQREYSLDDDIGITANIAGLPTSAPPTLYMRYAGENDFKSYVMRTKDNLHFSVELPKAHWHRPGVLEYAIALKTAENTYETFPGGASGLPTDWDFIQKSYWKTIVKPSGSAITLFSPRQDATSILSAKNAIGSSIVGAASFGPVLQASSLVQETASTLPVFNLTLASKSMLVDREVTGYNAITLQLKAPQQDTMLQVALLDRDGLAYGKTVSVDTTWRTITIKLDELTPVATVLPNGYPKFTPATIGPVPTQQNLSATAIQGIQIALDAKDVNEIEGNIALGEINLVKSDVSL